MFAIRVPFSGTEFVTDLILSVYAGAIQAVLALIFFPWIADPNPVDTIIWLTLIFMTPSLLLIIAVRHWR